MTKRFIGALAALFAFSSGAFSLDIAEGLLSGDLWKLGFKDLKGVRYYPIDNTSARVPQDGGLTVKDLAFGETVVTWDEQGTLSNLLMMIYNKGDDGVCSKEEYEEKIAKTIEALNELTGVKGKARKVPKKEAGVNLKSWIWEWKDEAGAVKGILLLEASASGKKKEVTPEFIRLKIGGSKEAVEKGGASDTTSRRELKTNVKRENGEVWIEGVNMVDQGQKGYCVPATVARVFAYYGMDGVDQHALAQLCNSSGEGGTNTQDMQTALEDISRAFHIRVNVLEGAGHLGSFVSDYNKMAQKMKKPPLTGYNIGAMKFDPDVLIAARSSPKQLKKWMEPVRKSIDAGIPVIWSVRLGIFPEPEIPQADGGHMRLIIGYKVAKNEKNKDEYTILYSDSWGAGHELKKMPASQACAMTTGRYILKPSR